MECPYESVCLNKGRCFKCYNLSLLKTKDDKKSKKVPTKSYDYKVASSDDSWKDLEQRVADKLNNIPERKEARRSRGSGNQWFEKGDVVDSILHPECKERTGTDLKSGDKSISIKKSWLEKAKEECINNDKFMCLPFRYKMDDSIYVIMDMDDLASLVTMYKSTLIENQQLEKELLLLKEEVRKMKE